MHHCNWRGCALCNYSRRPAEAAVVDGAEISAEAKPASKVIQKLAIAAVGVEGRSVGGRTVTKAYILIAQKGFESGSKRVLLEQLRSYMERDPGGTVVISGHASSNEKSSVAEQRALNASAVITAGSGVCLSVPQSQVMVNWPGADQGGVSFDSGFCASSVGGATQASEGRRVVVWFVPSGGQMPESATGTQGASTLNLSRLGCPK